MLSEATSEAEDDLTKIIVSSLSHALTDQNETASSLDQHGSDIFSEAPGSSIEALALDPPLSEGGGGGSVLFLELNKAVAK